MQREKIGPVALETNKSQRPLVRVCVGSFSFALLYSLSTIDPPSMAGWKPERNRQTTSTTWRLRSRRNSCTPNKSDFFGKENGKGNSLLFIIKDIWHFYPICLCLSKENRKSGARDDQRAVERWTTPTSEMTSRHRSVLLAWLSSNSSSTWNDATSKKDVRFAAGRDSFAAVELYICAPHSQIRQWEKKMDERQHKKIAAENGAAMTVPRELNVLLTHFLLCIYVCVCFYLLLSLSLSLSHSIDLDKYYSSASLS